MLSGGCEGNLGLILGSGAERSTCPLVFVWSSLACQTRHAFPSQEEFTDLDLDLTDVGGALTWLEAKDDTQVRAKQRPSRVDPNVRNIIPTCPTTWTVSHSI